MPELDIYNPDNGWRPWPEPCSTTVTGWRGTARRRSIASPGSTRIAKASIADGVDAFGTPPSVDAASKAADPARGADLRRRTSSRSILTIYRTLADPAYLDLSIDPDDRPVGSLFAVPDPLDANYGRGGVARTMTARGWLSTWSGLSSHARLADTMPQVTVPTLLVHPTAGTEIRVWQAEEIVANAGAGTSYVRDEGRSSLP